MDRVSWLGSLGYLMLEESKASEANLPYPVTPPPPYSQTSSPTPDYVPEYETSNTTNVPAGSPQPHHNQSASCILHVSGDRSNGWHVLDNDKVTELFKARSSLGKPHLRVTSSATGNILGTATFNSRSERIDAIVRGSQLSMMPCGTVGTKGYMYSSPAHCGAKMTWTTQGHNSDLLCLDEHDVVIASFRFSESSVHKSRVLEIRSPTANNKRLLEEEVVVTALAIAECVLHVL